MKKFLVILLCICLVCGIESPSMAAKKRAKKSKAQQGDKVEQILKQHKPYNPINAQIIRSVMKKYKNNLILAITVDSDKYDVEAGIINASTGAKKRIGISADRVDFLQEVPEKACIAEVHFMGGYIEFLDAKGKYISRYDHEEALSPFNPKGGRNLGDMLIEMYSLPDGNTADERNTATLPLILY